MASVKNIRTGLKTRLETIDGLQVYSRVPGQMVPPAAVVMPESIDFDATMGRGSDTFTFTVQMFVQLGAYEDAQDALDEYLDGSSSRSVKAAIEADQTLGGVVDFAVVSAARNYGTAEYGGIDYFTVEFVVEVTA